MADQKSRGGKKTQHEKEPEGKKHQAVAEEEAGPRAARNCAARVR